jgi:O-antigen/teichoic acid export membrane protein
VSSSRGAIAKDTAVFTGSTLVIQALAFVAAVFIRKRLGPEMMGVWALLQVVQGYLAYTNLGMTNAFSRELPARRGRGEGPERLAALRDTAYTYIWIVSAAAAACLAAYALVARERLSAPFFWGLVTLAALTFLERRNNFAVQMLYAEKRFSEAAAFRVASSGVNAAAVVALTWVWGIYGFFAANVASYAFNAAYLRFRARFKAVLRMDVVEVRSLLALAVPLFAYQLATSFFISLDKLAIGKFLGLTELGIYSIAVLAAGWVFLLPNMMQVVLLPWTMERFGDPAALESQRRFSVLPGRVMIAYFSLAIGFFWILAPLLCRYVLGEYAAGIPAMKAALFGAAFVALQQQMYHICLGHKRHLGLLPAAGVLSAAYLAGAWSLARRGAGITELALLMTALQAVYYLFTALRALAPPLSLREAAAELSWNVFALAACAAFLAALDAMPDLGGAAAGILKLVLFAAFWAALMRVLEGKLGLLTLVRETWTAWAARRAGAAKAGA